MVGFHCAGFRGKGVGGVVDLVGCVRVGVGVCCFGASDYRSGSEVGGLIIEAERLEEIWDGIFLL